MHFRSPKRVARCVPAMFLILGTTASHAQQGLCIPGKSVMVSPGDHPATVLAGNDASCRVHYEDGAFPDGWTYTFNVKSAGEATRNAPVTAMSDSPPLGRYDIAVGRGAFDGYLFLRSASVFELFLPGGKSAGGGAYAFDPSSTTIHWLSGPLTDPGWDGTQKVEGESAVKIRIGARAVATFTKVQQ